MELTRRQAIVLASGGVAAAAMGVPVAPLAAEQTLEEAIAAFTGGAPVTEGGVDVTAPEIAENGNTVPIEVYADGASSILVLADGNPNPGVATFTFGALAATPSASTRIRLAQSQNVVAVAKLQDGSFVRGARAVKVTIGGCGG